jgi:hypothetical protein
MPLNYVKHEPISLRKHSGFSEVWLHDRIAALRDALPPKLLSGEIRIPAAEKLVEDVA